MKHVLASRSSLFPQNQHVWRGWTGCSFFGVVLFDNEENYLFSAVEQIVKDKASPDCQKLIWSERRSSVARTYMETNRQDMDHTS